MRRILALAPALAFAALVVVFGAYALHHNPQVVPRATIGQAAPADALPSLDGAPPRPIRTTFKGPTLVNFFASWCVPCIQEAPVLMTLKQLGLPLWGIAYKDKADATAAFLQQNGDPYVHIARDEPGRVAIDFGVYGVPESYLVDKAGIVRWRWAGGLSEDVVRDSLAPLLQSLT